MMSCSEKSTVGNENHIVIYFEDIVHSMKIRMQDVLNKSKLETY